MTKRLLILMATITMICMPTTRAADLYATSPSGHTLYYNFVGTEVELTWQNTGTPHYTDLTGDVIIPDSVQWGTDMYAVTSIGDNAFEGCNALRSVVIPSTVNSIGSRALYTTAALIVYFLSPTQPSMGTWAFNFGASPAPLFVVPCGSLNNYTLANSTGMSENIAIVTAAAESERGRVTQTHVACDGTAIIEATPYYGYHFSHWSNGNIANPDTLHLTTDSTVTAFFAKNLYPVKTKASEEVELYDANWNFVNSSYKNKWVFKDNMIFISSNGSTRGYKSNSVNDISDPEAYIEMALDSGEAVHYSFQWSSEYDQNKNDYLSVYILKENTTNKIVNYSKLSAANSSWHTETGSFNVTSSGTYRFYIHWFNNAAYTTSYPAAVRNISITTMIQGHGTVVSSADSAGVDDTITLIAQPTYGYLFQQWADGNTDNPRQFIYAIDSTYTAIFEKKVMYLTALSNDTIAGAVSPTIDSTLYENNIIITATPNYGYHFVRWSNGLTANPLSITLQNDTAVTAYFAKNHYTICGSAPRKYSYSRWSTKNGHNGWLITDTGMVYIWRYDDVSTTSYLQQDVDLLEGETYTLSFQWLSSTQTYGTYSHKDYGDYLQVSLYDVVSNVIVYTSNKLYNDGLAKWHSETININISGTGTYRLEFLWINNDNSNLSISHYNSRGSAARLKDISFIQNGGIYRLDSCGMVSGCDTVDYLDTAALHATPNYGYHWGYWSDGYIDNPRNVVVTQDTHLVAVFVPNIYQVSTTSSDNNMGSATSSRGSADYIDTVVITATPFDGYQFDNWSNGSTANPDTLTLENDTSLVAHFSIIKYQVNAKTWVQRATGYTEITDTTLCYVSGTGKIACGDSTTLTAIGVDTNFHFQIWGGEDSSDTLVIHPTCDTTLHALFTVNQYAIHTKGDNYGSAYVYPYGITSSIRDTIYNINYHSQVTLQAYALTGYHFTQWSDGNTDNPRTVLLTQDTLLTAMFEPNIYSINVSRTPTYCGTVSGGGIFSHGDAVTLTATPYTGYQLEKWTYTIGDNNYTYTSYDNPLQFIASNTRAYTAHFEPAQYTITINSQPSNGGTVSGGGAYEYSTTCIISATAKTHYHFTHWSDGDTNATRTLVLTQDTMLTAIFAPNPYTLTLHSADSAQGSVVGSGVYFYGDSVPVRAEPIEHHHLLHWSNGSTANPDTVVILGDMELTATFAIDTYIVVVQSSDIMKGTASGGGEFVYGTPCTVTATAMSGYEFVSWSNGVTYNPYTFMPTTDISLTAEFADEGQVAILIVQSADLQMGTVSGGGPYAIGAEAVIGATPFSGYHFSHWQDGNTANPRTIVVSAEATYIAYFAPDQVQQYTIEVFSTNDSMGSVLGGGTFEDGSTIQISATAFAGYHFVKWDDENTDNPRTVIVTHNATYRAYFAPDSNRQGIDDVSGSKPNIYVRDGHVFVENTDAADVHVYDMIGRRREMDNLPLGVYIVRIGDRIIHKVVVIR